MKRKKINTKQKVLDYFSFHNVIKKGKLNGKRQKKRISGKRFKTLHFSKCKYFDLNHKPVTFFSEKLFRKVYER